MIAHVTGNGCIKIIWLLVLSVALLGIFDRSAFAQTLTDFDVSSGFSCSGGVANGDLLTTGDCTGSPADGQVFSYFICRFEQILNEALGDVYCAITDDARPAVTAALTLLVVCYGVAFLMGVSPFTAKELMMLATKFSLVLVFATEAQYMIGIGYNLFMSIAKEGIIIVLSYLFDSGYTSGGDIYRIFDESLKEIMSLASSGETPAAGATPAATPGVGGAHNVPSRSCDNAIFAMFAITAAAFPPLAFIGIYFVVKLLWVMLRAVFGYCQGILGVTFLITLSPIYVSFALFKPTRTLFDKWIQYLISFSFQMVIVFAFLGMVFSILDKMSDDVSDYADLVVPYQQEAAAAPGIFNRFSGCSICKLKPTNAREKPECESNEPMDLTELMQNQNFLNFVVVKLFAMIIMFYVLDVMMGFVPQMAVFLAGPKYAGTLGGGAQPGVMSLPGEQAIGGMLGEAGKAMRGANNTPEGIVQGFMAAGRHALTGQGGVLDTVIRSAVNPQEPMREPTGGTIDGLLGAATALTGAALVTQEISVAPSAPAPPPRRNQ